MTDRPRLSTIDLWARREEACLQVLDEALQMLAQDPGPQDHEDEINRRLYRMLNRATYQYNRREDDEVSAIIYEGRNTPAYDDEQRQLREHKRPDFQWAWIDEYASNPDDARRELILECKRLRGTTNRRVFCELYISHGVCRYTAQALGYGKGQRSGAMVGYLQQISITDALAAVNAAATVRGVNELEVTATHGEDRASLEHQLVRGFAVSPYRLRHRWIRTA
jgi:hypothetical protein